MNIEEDMYIFVRNGNLDVIKHYTQNNRPSLTLLKKACICGRLDMLKHLISKKITLNKIEAGRLLIRASSNGHLEIVKHLVENYPISDSCISDALYWSRSFEYKPNDNYFKITKYLKEISWHGVLHEVQNTWNGFGVID